MIETVYVVETWKLVNTNAEVTPFRSKEEALAQYRKELIKPYERNFKYVRLVEKMRDTGVNGDVEILDCRVLREAVF